VLQALPEHGVYTVFVELDNTKIEVIRILYYITVTAARILYYITVTAIRILYYITVTVTIRRQESNSVISRQE